jgi:phosphate transport system permease protein
MALIFGKISPIDAILLRKEVLAGLFPAIFGTLILVSVSMIWAVPVGIAAGVYMAEYSTPKQKICFNMLLDILAGIPSIVVGLFGFTLAILLHKYLSERIGPCFLISSIALSALILPYIVRTTEQSIENTPFYIKTTGLLLGGSKLQNIIYVLIPYNVSGITSGIILAIGRCAEDTAVIMLTGVVAMAGLPSSIFSGYEALPFYIFYIASNFSSQEELATGFGASIILLILCAFFFTISCIIKRKVAMQFAGHT